MRIKIGHILIFAVSVSLTPYVLRCIVVSPAWIEISFTEKIPVLFRQYVTAPLTSDGQHNTSDGQHNTSDGQHNTSDGQHNTSDGQHNTSDTGSRICLDRQALTFDNIDRYQYG
ncbi:MAG: hypothetical protein KFH87_01265 [Bacteroidetes bacterium]|nr:hypothetical protein [Bacteroidota bacterium]